jgi:hypothetical protein
MTEQKNTRIALSLFHRRLRVPSLPVLSADTQRMMSHQSSIRRNLSHGKALFTTMAERVLEPRPLVVLPRQYY